MKTKIVILLIVFCIKMQGQNVGTLFEYAPNNLKDNPAFAGALEKPTLSLFDMAWYDLFSKRPFTGDPYYQGFSYQQYYDKLLGGLSFNYTYESFSVIQNRYASIAYSPTIKLSENLGFKPGIGLGYDNEFQPAFSYLGYQNMPSGPTIIVANGPPNYLIYVPSNVAHYFDLNAGALLYNHNFSLGFSMHNITNPVNNFEYEKYVIPVSFTANFNYNFLSSDDGKTWAISPNITYQNENKVFEYGADFKLFCFMAGVGSILPTGGGGFGTNSYFLPMIGFQNKFFRVSYSNYYDYNTLPKGWVNGYGETTSTTIYHEISFIINLPYISTHFSPPIYTKLY